jgi:hypothetical protein
MEGPILLGTDPVAVRYGAGTAQQSTAQQMKAHYEHLEQESKTSAQDYQGGLNIPQLFHFSSAPHNTV